MNNIISRYDARKWIEEAKRYKTPAPQWIEALPPADRRDGHPIVGGSVFLAPVYVYAPLGVPIRKRLTAGQIDMIEAAGGNGPLLRAFKKLSARYIAGYKVITQSDIKDPQECI